MFVQSVKNFLEKAFRCRIYRNTLPRGTDLFVDLDKAFGLENFRTVFDVGANVGQSTAQYLENFTNASIYAFEPVRETYDRLRKAIGDSPRVDAHCCGFGREPGTVSINVNADYNSISSIRNRRPGDFAENIKIDSIDHFCDEHGVGTIDLMKIDTEGYEMEVLGGATEVLKRQAIRFLMLECEPMVTGTGFVAFKDVIELLGQYGFLLFGIYGQANHWDGRRALEYFNPLFVCQELAKSKMEPIAPGLISALPKGAPILPAIASI